MHHDSPTDTIDAAAWSDLLRSVPALAPRLGLLTSSTAGASVLVASRVDHILFNRAKLWAGSASGVDRAAGRAVEIFRRHAVPRYFVQFRQDAHGAHTDAVLRAQGLQRYHRDWIQLLRDTAGVPPAPVLEGLRIQPAQSIHAPAVADLLCECFDLPVTVAPLLETLVGRPGWHVHVVSDGERPIAAGALFVQGRAGYLAFGATQRSYRRRGAQRALIHARIETARALGCLRLVSETGAEVPGEPQPSFNNLVSSGFEPSAVLRNYSPPNVRWQQPATVGP